jgi:hypothetical protein
MVRAESLRRAVAHALVSAPGLGALAVAVGHLGLRGAARLCKTRRPPAALRRAWEELGYRVEQLPSAEDFRLLMVGIEVHRALYVARRVNPAETLAAVAKPLGHAQQDVLLGLRLVRAYGCRTDVHYEELGAI